LRELPGSLDTRVQLAGPHEGEVARNCFSHAELYSFIEGGQGTAGFMDKRWSKDGQKLAKSWTSNREKMDKRWSKDRQKLDKNATSSQYQNAKVKMQN
jgi:hypothetical protein